MVGKQVGRLLNITNKLANQINMADLIKNELSHGHLGGPFKKFVFDQMHDLTLGQNGHFS